MMMEGFSLGPRASNASAGAPRETDRRWSAHERAQRVAHDAGLRGLLSEEIERSGFLTSAGHRAVYQRFLHSDAVDEAMTKAQEKKTEGRLRRMMSEHSRRRNSSTSSLFRSSSSLFSSFLSDTSFDHRSIEMEVAEEEVVDHAFRDGNIAPRRRRPSHHEAADAYSFRNIAPRRASHSEIQVVYAPSTELPEFSSDTDDIDDESVVHDAATAAASYALTAEKEDERRLRAERLESMRLAYASRVFQLLKGQEDDDHSVCSDRSDEDEDSDADESGWIPWPEQRD